MITLFLLVVALVSLALGLVTSSAVWLVGSCCVSAAAGWLLFRTSRAQRSAQARSAHLMWGRPGSARPVSVPGTERAAELSGPRSRHRAGPAIPATELIAALIADRRSTSAQRVQASAAPSVRPESEQVQARLDLHDSDRIPDSAGILDSDGTEVWVVDGRPRYHRKRCEFIYGQDSEAIPLSQAAEDGFIPCSLCQPPRRGAGQRAD